MHIVESFINGTPKALEIPKGTEISQVWTILDKTKLFGADGKPQPKHHHNAFVEDRTHDWTYRNGQFHYFSRTCERGETAEVLIILERSCPLLPGNGPYLAKDQAKSDQATKFIGRGSERSSTNAYRLAWGRKANCGVYFENDVVFVSAEGGRRDRLDPDIEELKLAAQAGVTFITDVPYDRRRPYNVGERQVEAFLKTQGYRESAPGRWVTPQQNSSHE